MCKSIVFFVYYFGLPMAGIFTISAGIENLSDNDQRLCREMIWALYGICK